MLTKFKHNEYMLAPAVIATPMNICIYVDRWNVR